MHILQKKFFFEASPKDRPIGKIPDLPIGQSTSELLYHYC